MTNSQIAKLLRNIAASYVIKNEKKFRFQIIAYQKAADAIASSTFEIKDLYKDKKLIDLPGVGLTIASHIEELLKTGKVKHFEWVTRGIPKSVFPLLEVPTIGPKRAYKLVKELYLNDPKAVVEKLAKLARRGKIAVLKGFGEKSQQDILQAISEYKLGKNKTQRMVLPYAFEIAQKLVSYLKASSAVIKAVPLGSLRRMMPTVGDIDIAVATHNPKEAILHFTSYPYKERIIEQGDTTASILVSGVKQIDLMTQSPDGFGSLLQHFTGSKNHNIKLREHALSKGLSLSEHGIKYLNKKTQTIHKYDTEVKLYNALGMDWIPPELREDTGEIEHAIKHQLPKLVESQDIKGDLHIHSNFPIEPSHDLGKDSIDDMIKQAQELGYEYIGFSEHNPSVSKHTNNQIYSLIARRNDYIENIISGIKNVRALKLLEIDILVNGNLAIDNKSLGILDGAIVSIHSSFDMNKEKMTKRVINGLSHPKVKILAHPIGRILNQRSGYDLDFEKIFDFCVKFSKALEINSWPTRLDLPDPLIREAIKRKVMLIINTDSHAHWQMNLMKYGVAMARRGWAQKENILNTFGYNEFIKWLTH